LFAVVSILVCGRLQSFAVVYGRLRSSGRPAVAGEPVRRTASR